MSTLNESGETTQEALPQTEATTTTPKVCFSAYAEEIKEEDLDELAAHSTRGRLHLLPHMPVKLPRRGMSTSPQGQQSGRFNNLLRRQSSATRSCPVPTRSCLRKHLCRSSADSVTSSEASRSSSHDPPPIVQRRTAPSPGLGRCESRAEAHLLPVSSCCAECDKAWKYGHLPSACNSDDEDDDDDPYELSHPLAYHVRWSKRAKRRYEACLKRQKEQAEEDEDVSALGRRISKFAAVDEVEASKKHNADSLGCGMALQRRWTDTPSTYDLDEKCLEQPSRDRVSRRSSISHPAWAEHLGSSTVDFFRSARLSGLFI